MKYAIVLCTAVVALLLVAGCSQIFPPPPGLTTPTATPTAAPQATTPVVIAVTTTPVVTYPPTPSLLSYTQVVIQKMAFNPPVVTVSAGSMVRWVNEDKVTHSVLFPASTHISMFSLSPGQAFSQTFPTPGVYNYTCSIYTSMQGSVIVTP